CFQTAKPQKPHFGAFLFDISPSCRLTNTILVGCQFIYRILQGRLHKDIAPSVHPDDRFEAPA
ncbi:MAG: hypothetical protein J6W70_05290, partial [Lentisphaeria bacterium]|nr:hypothetical protein [Lentisphaeria bacterium]